jgi:hypothetical protein
MMDGLAPAAATNTLILTGRHTWMDEEIIAAYAGFTISTTPNPEVPLASAR